MQQVSESRSQIALGPEKIAYVVTRENVVPSQTPSMVGWRGRLFSFLFRNARQISDTFQIPPQQLIEIDPHVGI